MRLTAIERDLWPFVGPFGAGRLPRKYEREVLRVMSLRTGKRAALDPAAAGVITSLRAGGLTSIKVSLKRNLVSCLDFKGLFGELGAGLVEPLHCGFELIGRGSERGRGLKPARYRSLY
jgi:hypothetical protein